MKKEIRMKANLAAICALLLSVGLLPCCVQAAPPGIQWNRIADLPGDQHVACAAVIDGLVYIVGGQNPSGPPNYNKMRIYNPTTDSWSDGIAMSTRRYLPGAGVVENSQGEKECQT